MVSVHVNIVGYSGGGGVGGVALSLGSSCSWRGTSWVGFVSGFEGNCFGSSLTSSDYSEREREREVWVELKVRTYKHVYNYS